MYPRLGFVATCLSLVSQAVAWGAPGYSGYTLAWQETFAGAGGTKPNANNWNTITDLHVNNELQQYTTSTRNLQLSGGETLQIVPWKDANQWTSGRVESKFTFTPASGKITFAEARIRFGTNSVANKKGLWPAFWLLGDSIRHGTGWPQCGELDILEMINGQLTGYGTIHCDVYPGGICNEPNGIGAATGVPDQEWHTWRIQWDRSSGAWRSQSITWYRDGTQFHRVTGDRINNERVWQSIAQSPMFFILNMAVGGDWPGPPNDSTLGGYGSMLEVAYVALYTAN